MSRLDEIKQRLEQADPTWKFRSDALSRTLGDVEFLLSEIDSLARKLETAEKRARELTHANACKGEFGNPCRCFDKSPSLLQA